jgi:hypothetical protein
MSALRAARMLGLCRVRRMLGPCRVRRMLRIAALSACAAPFITSVVRPALAQEAAGTRWPVAGVEAPKTQLVLEAYVTIASAVDVGQSDAGTRRFIPITGGRFVGDGIKGEVMAGGADWQLVRPDGVLEVNALYSIRTDDGVTIVVDNRGIIVPAAPPAAGRPAQAPYVRTTPRFHAPQGKYDWLNKGIFVGGIAPAAGGGAVVIRVFRVL